MRGVLLSCYMVVAMERRSSFSMKARTFYFLVSVRWRRMGVTLGLMSAVSSEDRSHPIITKINKIIC